MAGKVSAAQRRVLARLAAGEVIYAWNGVSRVTAFALVRDGQAAWAVEPHVVLVRSDKPGAKTRHQLEWGLKAAPERQET